MSQALRSEYEQRVAGEAAVSGNKVPAFQRKFGVSAWPGVMIEMMGGRWGL